MHTYPGADEGDAHLHLLLPEVGEGGRGVTGDEGEVRVHHTADQTGLAVQPIPVVT